MQRALIALISIASLCGCATRWTVDSTVDSHSSIAAMPAGASYRFERLPSQQANAAAQDSLEAMAGAALDRVGLRRDDRADGGGTGTGPRYTAQVGARVDQALSPWADPWRLGAPPWGPGFRSGWYGGGWYGGGGFGGFPQAWDPWYVREVSVVLREPVSGQVVYETRARNDGPYSRSADILPVMFDAALKGFPNPPAGTRRVDLPLGTVRP